MWRLSMTSLFVCLWLAEIGYGNLGDTLGELHTEFAVNLYQTLSGTDNISNLVVSPVSVTLSLGLLQFGARGRTLDQLENALRYNVNDERVQDFLLRVQRDVANSTHSVQAQLAGVLFIPSGTQLSPAFTQHASAWANNSLVYTNFSQPNETRSQLEQWVRRHSDGEAGTHVPGSDSAGRAGPQMVLVSTVSFRGTWQKHFLPSETQNLPFTLPNGSVIKVPMMYQATEVNFGQFLTPSEHRYTVVELPYLGGSFSMLVVLPSDRKTLLSELEPRLSARAMGLWETGLRRTKMDVFLPRFKIQNRLNMRSILSSLGISDIFDPVAADFRGVSAQGGLYVSEAFHEARMEVTEEGTKAGASTAMVLLKRSRSPVFKADRPFLFLLRQVSTGSILFMGRVVKPAEQTL